MWRTYAICVLIGLLIAATLGSATLVRQVTSAQADATQLRQRLTAAESAQASLQQQVDQLKVSATPGPQPTPSGPGGARIVQPAPQPTPASVVSVPAVGVAAVPAPTLGGGGAATEQDALQQIEDDVATLRGLQPKTAVPVRYLDQQALQRYFVDRFNQDYLPSERESDQKLLTTLGLVGPNESVVQILLDVLQEQVSGAYNVDDKVMYMVDDNGQFGPDEKISFAHEFTLALQDQYYDLSTLAPKHPDNDDRSLAIQALSQGDATLMQRLWSQQKLSTAELNQAGQNAATSNLNSAPLFLREQLLFPYGDGFNFVRQIYQTSGYAAVDDVFRNPPDSTAQILHVDKYRNHVKPVEVTLPDLSQGALGDGWRQINSNVMGELDLRLILTQLIDSAHGVQGSNGWSGDRWELLEKNGRQAVVIKSVWDSENDATNFFNAFSMAMKNRFFGASEVEASASRQALTASNAATEVRRSGQTVVTVISFDRQSAQTIADAVGY